jgi:2-hydroxycyclohexanecarboxyl-CoA dehydrogenase
MDRYLRGRVILVTGGGQGIGREICLAFAREGASVGVNDIDIERATSVREEIVSLGGDAIVLSGDVSRWEEVAGMTERLAKELGGIDVLVNNAGIVEERKLFVETDATEWNRTLSVCLYGVLHCDRAVLPEMIEKRTGRIVSVTSDAGRVGEAKLSIYSAAKAAIVGHTKALAKEVGGYGINVNVVSPGSVETEATLERRKSLSDRIGEERASNRLNKQLSLYPIGRFGQPIDIANAVLFLSSDASSFITGQVLSVNGGFSMLS